MDYFENHETDFRPNQKSNDSSNKISFLKQHEDNKLRMRSSTPKFSLKNNTNLINNTSEENIRKAVPRVRANLPEPNRESCLKPVRQLNQFNKSHDRIRNKSIPNAITLSSLEAFDHPETEETENHEQDDDDEDEEEEENYIFKPESNNTTLNTNYFNRNLMKYDPDYFKNIDRDWTYSQNSTFFSNNDQKFIKEILNKIKPYIVKCVKKEVKGYLEKNIGKGITKYFNENFSES